MTPATALQPADLAQGQLDAYNAQDLDAHCAFFADDVVVADLNGDVTIRGMDAYRAKYRSSPYLSSMISTRARAATVRITPRATGV